MAQHIPNLITIFRLVITVPILLLFPFIEKSPMLHFWLLALTILAALSDFLDGYLARKWQCISDFGKIHDPLADKWLAVLFLPLVTMGMIHYIPVALLWLCDITKTHLRAQTQKPFAARLSGKIKTSISFPLLCLLIGALPVEKSYLAFMADYKDLLYQSGWLLALVCVWSGWDYYYQIMIKNRNRV